MAPNDWGAEPLTKEQRPGIRCAQPANAPNYNPKAARHQDEHLQLVAKALRAEANHQAPPQAKATRRMARDLVRPPTPAEPPQVRCAGCRKLRRECEKKGDKIATLKARIAELEALIAAGGADE